MAYQDFHKNLSSLDLPLPTSGPLLNMAHIGITDIRKVSWRMACLVQSIFSKFIIVISIGRCADSIRPKSGTPTPFTMISNNSNTLRQLNEQVNKPQVVVLSDWSHFTSGELRNISIAADIDPMWVATIILYSRIYTHLSWQMWRLYPYQRQRKRQLPWRAVPHELGATSTWASTSGPELDWQRMPSTHKHLRSDVISSWSKRCSTGSILWLQCHKLSRLYYRGRSPQWLGQPELHQHRNRTRNGCLDWWSSYVALCRWWWVCRTTEDWCMYLQLNHLPLLTEYRPSRSPMAADIQ